MQRHFRTLKLARLFALVLTLASAALLSGCQQQVVKADPQTPPPPTYSGPDFLRGTVGSLGQLQGYEPMLVSGYGLVVLPEETGSPECPPALRGWMLDEIRKFGVGRTEYSIINQTPEQFLASRQTAVVSVEGRIPPGATRGTRFDLIVSALPNTQTTSLAGGILYTCPLSVGGIQFGRPVTDVVAEGRGPIFLNPFREEPDPQNPLANLQTSGLVLGGGAATRSPTLRLVLARPSFRLASELAQRINGQYGIVSDERSIAEAKSDTVIQINIIDRYRDRPDVLLNRIRHLFANPTHEFTLDKAQQLAEVLSDPANHIYADAIAASWTGMTRQMVEPIIRPLYASEDPVVRLAALQAGAAHEDAAAVEPLIALANEADAPIRHKAVEALGEMLVRRPNHLSIGRALRRLLDSDDPQVRLAALRPLDAVNDPSVIQHFAFPDKLELIVVASNRPMIYVTRSGAPRIVIFGNDLGFEFPLLYSESSGRFMLRNKPEQQDTPVGIFYRSPTAPRAIQTEIPNSIAYMIGMMAHQPQLNSDTIGMDMSYSQIVGVLHRLHEGGFIEAPFILEASDLRQQLDQLQRQQQLLVRPETSPENENESNSPLVPRPETGDNPTP